jgi:polyhydroxyalkanoate synthesis regulator phasin
MNASDKDISHMDKATEEFGTKVQNGGKSAMRAAEDMTDAAKRGMEHAGSAVRDTAATLKETADEAIDEGKSRLGQALHKAQDLAADAKEALVAGAGSTLSAVKDVAVEQADVARESLSDVGQRLAATLERASAETDSDALKSRVLNSVAQGLTSASDALRQRSVADLTADVKTLARRHPGAFMAAAAVAGFAAARFIRSSSKRRMAENEPDYRKEPRV